MFDVAKGASFRVEVPGEPEEQDWLSVDRLGRYVQVVINSDLPGPRARATVHVIDVQRQALLPHTFELDRRTSYAAEFTSNGQALVTATQDRIDLWDLATGEKLSANLYEAADGVLALSVHPNGRLAALGLDVGTIEVIDLTTGELKAPPLASERFSVVPAFSNPDGRWLAATYSSGRVVVWDTRSGRSTAFGTPLKTSATRCSRPTQAFLSPAARARRPSGGSNKAPAEARFSKWNRLGSRT